MDVRTILCQCRLFSQVDAGGMDSLESMAFLQTVDKGEHILRQGQDCPGLYVVGEGLVRIYKLNPSGKEHVLHLAGTGSTFAEVAVLADFPCPAWAEVLEDSHLLVLPAQPLRRLVRSQHALCLQLLNGLCAWVRHLTELMETVVLRDATCRLAFYFQQHMLPGSSAVTLPGARKHLASHLNLTPETLSRSLRKLSDAGILSQKRDQVLIHDRAGLDEIAEGMFPLI